jgi:hypothetical protein
VSRPVNFPRLAWFRIAVALLAIAALGGCVTAAQKRAQDIARTNIAGVDQMRTCTEAVYNSPAFDAARRRLPADYGQATLEQETDPGVAKDPEIAAVLLAQPQLQACRKTFLDKIGADTPSLIPTYAGLLALTDGSLSEVMQKKKGWGDHVRDVKLLLKKADTELDDEIKKIADGLSQDPKAVQARKEAADKALAVYATTEKALTTMRRPVITRVSN